MTQAGPLRPVYNRHHLHKHICNAHVQAEELQKKFSEANAELKDLNQGLYEAEAVLMWLFF